MKLLHKLLSTWFLSGTVTKMPGTIGSLASFPLIFIILHSKTLGALTIFILFIIALWSVGHYIKYYNTSHDPKEVVIDEVVGQLLTILLTSLYQEINYLIVLLCFLFFRFFDIIKIWPINLIDKKIKNPLGVMLDDIVAAVLACIAVWVFCYLLLAYIEQNTINYFISQDF
jgi:phosphatidylglycerophosphatase A